MLKPVEVELPRHRSCGAAARRLVEEHARHELSEEDLADLKLVVTELVDNAYLHGEGRIRLKLGHRGDRILVEVIDEGEGASVKVIRAASAGGGRGLQIVEQLARAWGAHEGTTHVWAELPLSRR